MCVRVCVPSAGETITSQYIVPDVKPVKKNSVKKNSSSMKSPQKKPLSHVQERHKTPIKGETYKKCCIFACKPFIM